MLSTQNIAEKLGHPKDAKLLIIHADDIGVTHSENRASFEAYEKNGINSGSVMVPCPWFAEAADWSVKNLEFDMGVHLTFTAEWKNYRWGGVLSAGEIPSLLDEKGFFYRSATEVVRRAKPAELEKEMRAQIDRAIAFGIEPTHLDSHMGTLFQSAEFFRIYLEIGREYGIPPLIPVNIFAGTGDSMFREAAAHMEHIQESDIKVDNMLIIDDFTPAEDWTEKYRSLIENMEPGLNEILVHTAFDDAEMKAVCIDHPNFGSAWRHRDFETLTDSCFRKLIGTEGIIPVSWREIQALYKQSN